MPAEKLNGALRVGATPEGCKVNQSLHVPDYRVFNKRESGCYNRCLKIFARSLVFDVNHDLTLIDTFRDRRTDRPTDRRCHRELTFPIIVK